MRVLRTVLCWLMALEAGLWFWAGSSAAGRAAELTYASRTGMALEELAVALAVMAVGILFATTCVAIWRGRASARAWAMVAGGSNVLFAGLMVVLLGLTRSGAHGTPAPPWVGDLLGAVAGMGAVTVAAFWQQDDDLETEKTERLRGDGTHPVVDQLVWGAGLVVVVGGMQAWWRWAHLHRLPETAGLIYFAEAVAAWLTVVLLHELGHALAGKAMGMRLRAFVAGPFQWRMREGQWRFWFRPVDVLATGGTAALVPTDAKQPKGRQMGMIAAGPGVSLASGLIALGFLLWAPGHAWAPEWRLLALFATFSLGAGVVNLAPFRRGASYSDGAQIFQLWSGGAWGDYHRALAMAGASMVTPMRPRDFDILAMEGAAGAITEGMRAVHLRLLEYSYYLDSGRLHEASQAINAAESARKAGEAMPVEFQADFVFAKAFVQRDAEGARAWWARLEAKKPAQMSANIWLAQAAWLWIEGKMTEARQAWEKGKALAEELPRAGVYDAERDKFTMLGRELEAERRMPRWHDDVALTR